MKKLHVIYDSGKLYVTFESNVIKLNFEYSECESI